MPSPFPGMDPFLEGDDWTSFHTHFATEIARQLTPLLRPKYVALPEKRIELIEVMEERAPHIWIEIRDRVERRLVTTIEILSPWNKRGLGRDEYLDKRRKLLCSSSHLVEIDLLRAGRRLPMKDPLPPAYYYVIVSRAEARPMVEVWPITLQDPLPEVPVPLLAGDPDVRLDLQAALRTVYDLGGFDLVLNYAHSLSPALSSDQAAWAAERLRASTTN